MMLPPNNAVMTLEKAHRRAFSVGPFGAAATASIVRAVNTAAAKSGEGED